MCLGLTVSVCLRCVFGAVYVIPAGVRRSSLPAGDGSGSVHQSGRSRRMDENLPAVRRFESVKVAVSHHSLTLRIVQTCLTFV